MRTEKLNDIKVRLRFQWRLWLKIKRSADVDSGEVEKAWKNFKESVTSTAAEVCGTKRCGDRKRR